MNFARNRNGAPIKRVSFAIISAHVENSLFGRLKHGARDEARYRIES